MFSTTRLVWLFAIYTLSVLTPSPMRAENEPAASSMDLTLAPAQELLLSRPEPLISAALKKHLLHGIGHSPPSRPTMTIRWAAGDIRSHQGAVWPMRGRLVLQVGGAMAVDNAVVTVIRDVQGSLNLNSAEGPVQWTVQAGNHGGYFAKSQFNTATGALGFVLPVILSHAENEIAARIYLAYAVTDDDMTFMKGWIGRPLLAESRKMTAIEKLTSYRSSAGQTTTSVAKAEPEYSEKQPEGRGRISGPTAAFLEPGIPLAPWCDEINQETRDGDTVEVQFISQQLLGQFGNVAVDAFIRPGPSFLEGRHTFNLLNGVTGTITAQTGGADKSLSFAQSHRGNRIAQSIYQPRLQQLTLDIPVEFGTDSGQAAYGDLRLTCEISNETADCEEPMALELTTNRSLVNLFGDIGPMSASGADLNCTASCERCVNNGCTNCRLVGCPSGGLCPTHPNAANCCEGTMRCACRNCGEIPP